MVYDDGKAIMTKGHSVVNKTANNARVVIPVNEYSFTDKNMDNNQ